MRKLGLMLAAALIVADQISKWWVVEKVMRPDGVTDTPFFSPTVIELTPFFNLLMTWNRGVSFGIFNNDGPWNALALSALSVVIVIALLIWLGKAQGRLISLALGAIIGGALGNVVDRVRWGAVADFLDVHAFGWHWPAFNLADSAITIGAILLILDSLFSRQNSDKN
ncbi:signal peptidase II [Magnetospirillum sulfuroxidans]|uniref:Lipoprotein signal peptidase n=1 Tax=Magnetospirillum sulfuroxidans TaxID=611300 RepID=A0ABS5IBR3_9PROT|nr:signal peptidase II [Magnetospirillum sulfuroxidans]MBR9971863.1 signal peptidase II [Magnetospirillum sulfuroxidans]